MEEKKYIKAKKGNRFCVLELQRVLPYTIMNEVADVGVYFNGRGYDYELYGKTFSETIKAIKNDWEYTNVKVITKKEFDDFTGEDYGHIKWEYVPSMKVKEELKLRAKQEGLEYIETQIVAYEKDEFENYYLDTRKEVCAEENDVWYTMDNF